MVRRWLISIHKLENKGLLMKKLKRKVRELQKRKDEVISMVKNNNLEATSAAEKKEQKPTVRMVPLFSLRTIIAVAIGLILGAGLGLGFFIVSPNLSFSSTEVETGGAGQAFMPAPTGPWESDVSVQIVNPGSVYMSIGQLENIGRLYAAKVNSFPFLEFLSQQLAEQAPEYSHTADELHEMINVGYDWDSPDPTILIRATAPTIDETMFLVSYVPEAFKSYLIVEESERQKQEYENTLKEIEIVKKAILEAEQELRVLQSQGVSSDTTSMESTRVALNAKIQALELELDREAVELATMIAEGNANKDKETQQQEYQETLYKAREVSVSLSKAQQELLALQLERPVTDISNDPVYITLNAKIRALESELDRLMTGDGETTGLAEMIVSGISAGTTYTNTLKKVEAASAALSEARTELAILESQSGDGRSAVDLDYEVAQSKVNNLNMQLSALKERLTILALVGVNKENWQEAQTSFDRISEALSEARTELATLESLESSERFALDLEYQVAQTKIDNLNRELTRLGEVLSSSFGSTTDVLEAIDFLAVKSPSQPLPILPDRMKLRDALMMGAVVGIGGAWLILNFRWLIKGASSSFEEEEEDEA